MALDLTQVASQVEGMAARLKADEKDREERLQHALETLRSSSANLESLKEKIEKSKTTWLVAGLTDGLDQHYEAPSCPPEFTVMAVDGSHIDVDRHSPVRCFLINIGSVILRYGEKPDAILVSQPTLYTHDQEMALFDPLGSGAEPIERALLGVKRTVEECQALAKLAEDVPPEMPALALLDGSLILWGLAGRGIENFVREELLDKGLLEALDKIKETSPTLALAAYISLPRSTDVVNALRVAICPHEPPDCDRYCPSRRAANARECGAIAGLEDRHLFERLLSPGERSATFVSRSRIVGEHYGQHEVRFFYLMVDDEIARVELPRWAAEDRGLLDLVHALVLQQCRLSQGYPVALSEAHEKAVVTAADRDHFWQLVEMALAENRLSATTSAKSRSKRTRWI